MNSYVPKPFNASQLIAAIAEATGRTIKREVLSATSMSEEKISNLKLQTSNSIDLTYLKNFCEGNEERMKKYITMFLDAVPSFQQKIEKAFSENDLQEIARQVHAFRPKVVMMGLKEVQELCLGIERRCIEGNSDKELKKDVTILLKQIGNATFVLNQLNQS